MALVLDTFDDDNNAYVFMVNSLGTQQDERWADNGRTRDITWDANWLSAGATSARGWTAEVAIPFETVRFAREATAWGFNAIRYLPRNLEQSHWVPGLSEWFRIDEIGSHHRPRSDRGRHQELRLHPLPAGGPPGGAGRHHGVRTRSALRAVQQHRDRLLLQSGLRHRRGRRRAGEPDALRAVVPGKAPLLPGRHGELSDPHRAVLLPPDRGHAVGREGQREGRQVEGQRAGQPDGLGDRHLERRDGRALLRVPVEPGDRGSLQRRGDRREPHLRRDERGLAGTRRDPVLLGLPRHDLTGHPVLRRPRRRGVDVLLPALLRLPDRALPRPLHARRGERPGEHEPGRLHSGRRPARSGLERAEAVLDQPPRAPGPDRLDQLQPVLEPDRAGCEAGRSATGSASTS